MNSHEHPTGDERPVHALTPEMLLAEGDTLLTEMTTCDNEKHAHHLRQRSGDRIPCLVDPLFQQVGLACLAGSSDTGKSSLLRQLGLAVSSGDTEWLGFPLQPMHRSVIYVATEDGEEATSFLLSRQARRYDDGEIERMRFIFEFDDILATLHRNLTRAPADLVIIDCFSDVYPGDLKDTQKIRAFLLQFQELARRHQCLVLFLHHTGKRTESLVPSKNNLLSGQGLEAKMRLCIELRADPMHPLDRHFCVVKGNYLPASMKRESHILHFDETTFTFTNTGERTTFELLVRGADVDDSKAKWEQAKELKEEGKSYSQIADAMGYSSKSSVLNLLTKAKKMGWEKAPDTEEETEGQEE